MRWALYWDLVLTCLLYILSLPLEHRPQTTKPEAVVHISLSKSIFQLFLGRPLPRWPCGVHCSTCLACCHRFVSVCVRSSFTFFDMLFSVMPWIYQSLTLGLRLAENQLCLRTNLHQRLLWFRSVVKLFSGLMNSRPIISLCTDCSQIAIVHSSLLYSAGFKYGEALGRIIIEGPYPPSNAIIYMHLQL